MKLEETQLFHQALDRYFGLPTLHVSETAEQLSSEGLLTSYIDYYHILNKLEQLNIRSLTDIGAGIGRSSLVQRTWFPNISVVGIESDELRVEIASKAGVKLIHADIETYYSSDSTNLTQSYYFYFPWTKSLFPLLNKLKEQYGAIIVVMESYGDFLELLKLHCPWLRLRDQVETISERHEKLIFFFEVIKVSDIQQENLLENPLATIANWSLAGRTDAALLFMYEDQNIELNCFEYELCFYPEQGFCVERISPRRLYWWKQIKNLVFAKNS